MPGLHNEGWRPRARPTVRSRAAFLERIHDGVHRDPGIDAEQVARGGVWLAGDAIAGRGGRGR
jgi:hypothetical protein